MDISGWRRPVLLTLTGMLAALAVGATGGDEGLSKPGDLWKRVTAAARARGNGEKVPVGVRAEENGKGMPVAALSVASEPRPGSPAPAFSLRGLDGHEYRAGGAREKPLLLNFWDASCPPCMEEAPDLARIYEIYKDRLDLYAVNVTFQDSRDEAAAFAAKNGYAFPVLLDEQGEATRLYRIRGLPTTFLIGKDGVIRDAFYLLDSEAWEAKIAKLLTD